jgi:flagellar M-ring protein FliF
VSFEKYAKQGEALIKSLTLRQQILFAVAAILVAGVLALFVKLTQKAEYKPLYTGLAPTDAQQLGQRLGAKNIPYEISADGTSVSVPADQLDKTRLDLAAEGLPQTGRLGFELFDKPNWAGSDFSEQVNYQRALEGELERTIQTLGNVESVRVHLVLPHESLFSEKERVAKAAVALRLKAGGLSDDQINAVTHLVASSVDNLSPENVTLIGADGRTPIVAKGRDASHSSYPPVEMEAAMAEKLVATLAPIVGQDHVKASVSVAYDPDSGDTTQEIYDPNNAVLVSDQMQEEKFGGSVPAGIPGTASNVPGGATSNSTGSPTTAGAANKSATGASTPATPAATPAAPTTGGTGASGQAGSTQENVAQARALNPIVQISGDSDGQRSESRTFAVSKTLRHINEPSGKIQKIAAAILVDDAVEQKKDDQGQMAEMRRKRTPEEMKQIEELAKAAIGFDATRGDNVSVQNVSFLVSPTEATAPPPAVERIRVVAEKWIWLLRYAMLLVVFLLVYALVLRPVKDELIRSLSSAKTAGALAAAEGAAPAAVENVALSEAQILEEIGSTTSNVQRVVKLKKHLAEKVKREPAQASILIRQWMHEGKETA